MTYEEPLYPIERIMGIIPKDPSKSWDIKSVLAYILDGSRFCEFKANYGPTLITGFGKLYGQNIGNKSTNS